MIDCPVKFCKKCRENNEYRLHGYITFLKDDCYECPFTDCRGELINLDFSKDDYNIITKVSDDITFLEAMIKLKQKDPIEYELKMSQFRSQPEQEKVNKQQKNNVPKCIYCGSTNIKPIGLINRGISGALWGLGSKKIGKQFHCNSCGGDF